MIRTTSLAQSRWLLTLGLYTFPIYLMNTIAIGLVKGVLLKFFPWDGLNFLVYVPFLFAGGLLLRYLVRECFLVKVPVLGTIPGEVSCLAEWRSGPLPARPGGEQD